MGATAGTTTPTATQETKFHTVREEVYVPAKPIAAESAAVVALDLFGSFLVNSTEEAKNFGNVLVGWDQIPKFSADHLNNKDGVVPNDHSVNFRISGQEAKLTLFPGTFYPTKKSKPMRRFPGVKEQLVEQALIHHATIQAEEQTVNGDTSYYVTFTINALARQLKAMGSTMSNTQIRQALDVLSSSVMTLSYGDDLKLDNRDTILPSFDRNNKSTKEGNNGDDIWRVKLHALIVQSILKVTYRQYPIGELKDYSPVGAALMRRIHYIVTNVSEGQPYKFTVQEMKLLTAGLNHVRLSGSMNAIKKELERMQADNYLVRFTVEEIFPEVRGRGRPVPIDYRFTLYPGPQWIKNMKAGSMRMNVIEQRLGLRRSQRPERHEQMMLSLSN
ncbi:hypothetical protein [Pseudomonas asiatica]|uniref:hypothetical protein n=1 Tax=Pseudomonas asiatica TaxID=2219225 RepID=UPI0010BF8E14|nr:hypothetical protein [Pseudomonas asiatica]EKT4529989.1 hypothetical protein [Pseudomonas putida]